MIKRRAAAKHVARARKIIEAQIDDTQMQEEAAEKALQCLEAALEARPGNDKAMEMKARLLLRLKRFAAVVDLLRHHLPTAASTASQLVASTPKTGGGDQSGGEISVCQSPASSTVSAASNSSSRQSSVIAVADSATKRRNRGVRRSDRVNPAERTRLLYSGQLEAEEAEAFYSFPCRSVPTLAAFAKSCCDGALNWIWRRVPRPKLWMWTWNHSDKSWRCRRSGGKKATKQQKPAAQWQSLVLGRACWHMGMLEDAMVLLQQRKKTASAASRRQSNSMRDDRFVSSSSSEHRRHGYQLRCPLKLLKDDIDRLSPSSEAAAANKILESIKRLLRRRAAAMAAMEAGLYAECSRHLTKIIFDGKLKKSTLSAMAMPHGFVAECYLQRATAATATGRVVDAIADCNRSLALLPLNAAALSLRASLLEMVRSYSDCLLDLQQLRLIYLQASLHFRRRRRRHDTGVSASLFLRNNDDAFAAADLPAVLSYIDGKISATRRKLRAAHFGQPTAAFSVDAHAILDIPRNCSREDARRAYLVLSLKHRVDKAAHFVDGCEFADVNLRDAESAREEAVASAARLSQLIRKAYRQLLSDLVITRGSSEEESEEEGGRGTAYIGGGGRGTAYGGGASSFASTSPSFSSPSSAAEDAAESIKDAWKFHYDDVAHDTRFPATSPAVLWNLSPTWNSNWAVSP